MDGVAGEQGHCCEQKAAGGQHSYQWVTAQGSDMAVGQTPCRCALPVLAGYHPLASAPAGCSWSRFSPRLHTQKEPSLTSFKLLLKICLCSKEGKPSPSSCSPQMGHSTQADFCQQWALFSQQDTGPCITPSQRLLSCLYPPIPLEEPPRPGHPPHAPMALTGRG